MNTRTAILINEARVKELLDCYGADSRHWPDEERASALALIKHSVTLQQYQQQAQQLDEAMGTEEAGKILHLRPQADRLARIINALPERQDNTVAFAGGEKAKPMAPTLSAPAPTTWWQYSAMAAAAVLVLAVTLLIEQPKSTSQPSPPSVAADASQDDLDQWFWEQATGASDDGNLDLSADDSEGPTTFMAMVELESSTDHN